MDTLRTQRVVIVDGYSTGRELVRELVTRNVKCLHLRSTPELPKFAAKGFYPNAYHVDLGYLGQPEEAVARLQLIRPDAVIAGSEWGVTYAERVAHAMGLPTNDAPTASARRNKFHMIEAVRKAGLHTAKQSRVRSVHDAHEWASRHGQWPVVVKPLMSAGCEGVEVCHSHADIDHAFMYALYRDNLLGCFNDQLLIQSHLSGPQFIVNTVSHGGRHQITDAWHVPYTTVPGGSIAMETMALLSPYARKSRELFDYTRAALSALGIENGAAHSELRFTPNGPALIETNARLMGGAMDRLSYQAAGMRTQASRYADILTAQPSEAARLIGTDYTVERHLTKVFFVFKEAAIVDGVAGLAKLKSLRSYHAHYRPLDEGERVWRTSDSLFCGGAVYLVHDDPHQIDADVRQFRRWEREGALYSLVPLTEEERGVMQ